MPGDMSNAETENDCMTVVDVTASAGTLSLKVMENELNNVIFAEHYLELQIGITHQLF